MQARHIVPISGKDSLSTALWLKAKNPHVDYEYIHNNVHTDPPEVYEWLERVESHLGKPIQHIGKNLRDVIYAQKMLPSRMARYCTRIAKIQPMEEYLKSDDDTPVFVYFGLRADESTRTGYKSNGAITPRYPLRDDKITLPMVYRIVDTAGLMPPTFFWRSLFHLVVNALGDDAHLLKNFTRPEFYALFSWRTRPNCYFCFFQRLYEWVGLLEHHPKLFYDAMKIESEVGADGYTWRQGYPLQRILEPDEQKRIKQDRVKQVVNIVYRKSQAHLFGDDIPDIIGTSCGLLCGK